MPATIGWQQKHRNMMKRCGTSLTRSSRPSGFTLIELMIVILVIAILVAIAVPVYLNATKNAKKRVAEYNYRVGCESTERIWFDISSTGSGNYDVDSKNWAEYVSTREIKIPWVDLERTNPTRLRHVGTWKGGVETVTEKSFDLGYVYGKICVYRGFLDPADNKWQKSEQGKNLGDGWECLTVIVCSQSDNNASFTSYYLGTVYSHGTFDWEQGTGETSNFALL